MNKKNCLSLQVVAATCDGASTNRKFFKFHKVYQTEEDSETSVVYKTPHLFDKTRTLYFISDAPHLTKTTRNNAESSGYTRKSDGKQMPRLMRDWSDGRSYDIIWDHIVRLRSDDKNSLGLMMGCKLTDQHVFLNSFSRMNVRFAAQVLSNTVALALEDYPDAKLTMQFIERFDKWFDCMNVRSFREHVRSKKLFRKPYTDLNDERFLFLNRFLDWMRSWKLRIEEHAPECKTKDKMFLSHQTADGLEITTRSVMALVKDLLSKGAPQVFTGNFNQDPLESYFGYQRTLCARNENPNLQRFMQNNNMIQTTGRTYKPAKGGNSDEGYLNDTPLRHR